MDRGSRRRSGTRPAVHPRSAGRSTSPGLRRPRRTYLTRHAGGDAGKGSGHDLAALRLEAGDVPMNGDHPDRRPRRSNADRPNRHRHLLTDQARGGDSGKPVGRNQRRAGGASVGRRRFTARRQKDQRIRRGVRHQQRRPPASAVAGGRAGYPEKTDSFAKLASQFQAGLLAVSRFFRQPAAEYGVDGVRKPEIRRDRRWALSHVSPERRQLGRAAERRPTRQALNGEARQ